MSSPGYPANHRNISRTLYRLDVSDREYDEIVRRIDEMMCGKSMYKFSVLGLLMRKWKLPLSGQKGCYA